MEDISIYNTYWAKYDGDTGRIHRLEHHLADVGAVMEAMLKLPKFNQPTSCLIGYELDDATAARLAVFAAIHDIGKANLLFQQKVWIPTPPRQRLASHTKDMMQLFNGADVYNRDLFFESMSWLDQAVREWDSENGQTVCSLMIAAMSHHGLPERLQNGNGARPSHWHACNAYGLPQPMAKISEIDTLVRGWFPDAFYSNGPRLPSSPQLQHYFLGMLQLADWVASDERLFPYEPDPNPEYVTIARDRALAALRTIRLDTTQRKLPANPASLSEMLSRDVQPNGIQTISASESLRAPVVIIESETGSGKTEAVLLRFQEMLRAGLINGMYFALPTRSAAIQIHERITSMINQMLPNADIEPVLAVPGYIRAGEHQGEVLPHYRVHWEDGADDGSRWSAEGSKRCLTAPIAVGTIDQAMLSVLQVKHAHLRAASLSGNLLVIDEVHASDTHMSTIIKALVESHTSRGGYTLMMSATLGESARSMLLGNSVMKSLSESKDVHYPALSTADAIIPARYNGNTKSVSIRMVEDGGDVGVAANAALIAARAGAKVLVMRNTVTLANGTLLALDSLVRQDDNALLFVVNGVSTLHHSRFAADDRKALDKQVEVEFGRNRSMGGRITIGTQTLEQSLDIDADLLITDLCPGDVLLQRIGRLHRHLIINDENRPKGYDRPQCIVLSPSIPTIELLGQRDRGLGPSGRVYKDLRVIEATRKWLMCNSVLEIPSMNREFVESITHPEVLHEIVESGIASGHERWRQHDNQMRGERMSDTQIAERDIIRWDQPFYNIETDDNDEVLFSNTTSVMTRLGGQSISVNIDPPQPSPFGYSIDQLNIPYWMIGSVGLANRRGLVAEDVELLVGGGFEFKLPNSSIVFRYDRLGLQN